MTCPKCGAPVEQYEHRYTLPERKFPAATLPQMEVSELRLRHIQQARQILEETDL